MYRNRGVIFLWLIKSLIFLNFISHSVLWANLADDRIRPPRRHAASLLGIGLTASPARSDLAGLVHPPGRARSPPYTARAPTPSHGAHEEESTARRVRPRAAIESAASMQVWYVLPERSGVCRDQALALPRLTASKMLIARPSASGTSRRLSSRAGAGREKPGNRAGALNGLKSCAPNGAKSAAQAVAPSREMRLARRRGSRAASLSCRQGPRSPCGGNPAKALKSGKPPVRYAGLIRPSVLPDSLQGLTFSVPRDTPLDGLKNRIYNV